MQKIHPATSVACDLETADARWIAGAFQNSHWPLKHCLAWITMRSSGATAIDVYLRQDFGGASHDQISGWTAATQSLLKALRAGKITAEAYDGEGQRMELTSFDWRSLRLERIGMTYCAVGAKRSPKYTNIEIEAAAMRKGWPVPSLAVLRGADAASRHAATAKALVEIMREAPNSPVSKAELRLRLEFADIPKRMFDKCFAEAAAVAKTPNWQSPGRRRVRNSSQS